MKIADRRVGHETRKSQEQRQKKIIEKNEVEGREYQKQNSTRRKVKKKKKRRGAKKEEKNLQVENNK